ncbi:MAG: type II toxin-antitoxin system RelE/ParE family toxin [Coriobacteriales bacterium]|jgi:mRNA interferase RelE/StbE|nr:type II toxin-antitoxin system RelE/ParE family toxin [Coriobacteriales bacterium]
MSYELLYSKKAEKQLAHMDANKRRILVAWLTKHIKGSENPRALGSPLKAGHKGKWRYRIGTYRVLAKIDDEALIVLALEIGHRRDVYRL